MTDAAIPRLTRRAATVAALGWLTGAHAAAPPAALLRAVWSCVWALVCDWSPPVSVLSPVRVV